MSQKCDICGKRPQVGYSVSHAHNKTKKRWMPNIQKVRAIVNGVKKRVRICTGCIKSRKIQKAI